MKKIIFLIFIVIVFFIFSNLTHDHNIDDDKSFITLPYKINTVAQNQYIKRYNHESLTNKSKFYLINNNLYNNITGLVSTNVKKIIDISSYQGIIDWDKVKPQIDGVILRIGFGNKTLDNKLEYNVKELKRLNIPYGLYLYSYAENKMEALSEAQFTKKIIEQYNLEPTLGVYYDIEEFYIRGKKIYLTKDIYQKIIETYINYLDKYDVSIYTYVKMYNYKFNEITKKYVTWIAHYNYYFKYENNIKIWQYSDSGIIKGIKGKVDMNVMFN